MMKKTVFGNVSNFQIHIGEDKRIGLKRAVENTENLCPVAKKSKPEAAKGRTSRKGQQENVIRSESVTKTIERKVKSISLDRPKISLKNAATTATVPEIPSKPSGYMIVTRSNSKGSTVIKPVVRIPSVEEESEEITEEKSIKSDRKSLSSPKAVVGRRIQFDDPASCYRPPPGIPSGVSDYDECHIYDMFSEPMYAYDIFQFYKQKEFDYLTANYMDSQPEVTRKMRTVLVDWLIEVQQNFSFNHETLYLAVKIIDRFLMVKSVPKKNLQLVGATAMLIAAKFDERIPPAIEDLVYSCDNLYEKKQVILMEIEILNALDCYIGFPLSYRFLRRYARVGGMDMKELTLARYILEMSLMEYALIGERESFIAAAALLLARKMIHRNKKEISLWSPNLQFYSGYTERELKSLVLELNTLISSKERFRSNKLDAVIRKYEHKVFLEVAKIAPLP
ncbi:cyclin B3 [Brevipalpus obovatus]|uniref:cyclin B3 n=1 Tax=Brevipalpus obovatus TaxID=246614 RepID=UPI003D9F852F